MAYDPNWPRWIQSSVANHFFGYADAHEYAFFTEELDERTTEFQETPSRIELRVNGPFTNEESKNFWQFEVDPFLLIFHQLGGPGTNRFTGTQMAGVMAQAAHEPIPITKRGNGVDDDQSLIGCLTLRKGETESVKVFHFGEVDMTNRIIQLAVDVRLEMCLRQQGM